MLRHLANNVDILEQTLSKVCAHTAT